MVAVAHRVAPNRSREMRERVWARVVTKLRGRQLCQRCNCTIADMGERCLAGLGEQCPGQNQIDLARTHAAKELGLS